MRHYPDLRAAGPRDPRIRRLFELQRQRNVQVLLGDAGDSADPLRPDIAETLRDRASLSLRPDQSPSPRKPVAITNFSELSDRDAGGFTFTTFVKRCFSNF